MRRYLIERDVHNRLQNSINETGARASLAIVEGASIDQVTLDTFLREYR